MKNLVIFLIILLGCKPMNNDNKKEAVNVNANDYIITQLDSVNNYYIIYARQVQDCYNYKIISKKEKLRCDANIIVGKKYNLELTSIFTTKIIDNGIVREITNNVNIDCIQYDSTEFCKEYKKGISDIHKSKNLKGLCYIKR